MPSRMKKLWGIEYGKKSSNQMVQERLSLFSDTTSSQSNISRDWNRWTFIDFYYFNDFDFVFDLSHGRTFHLRWLVARMVEQATVVRINAPFQN